ncbi:protein-tyrosine phosphatase family protein [Oerskovia sp. KBS0722]|uniref:protein-tyrosine phosphatase family protein n=1 Tax=Oerskovia sp. KBS0722 TaxID=1179673 RepID=UPI00110D6633|nr:protein-tyrosine phosphatase family protein [Oerskovia sp. KBS0722]QDW61475.1 protein phosphatase [Oerskovia sp. KBS0722]
MSLWSSTTAGLVVLPDGRRVRGRGLAAGPPDATEVPDLGLYLTARPHTEAWESRWVSWPDFGLPRSTSDAVEALRDVFERSSVSRVEIACDGGTGRTGTAIALLARWAGVPADDAVAWVRAGYRPRAVETAAQERLVARLDLDPAPSPQGRGGPQGHGGAMGSGSRAPRK